MILKSQIIMQQMDSFRTDLSLHALLEDGKVLDIPGGVPLLTSCSSLLQRSKTKSGVFHLMFNSCKTADVSHFKNICYIIRLIYGNNFFFHCSQRKLSWNSYANI